MLKIKRCFITFYLFLIHLWNQHQHSVKLAVNPGRCEVRLSCAADRYCEGILQWPQKTLSLPVWRVVVR